MNQFIAQEKDDGIVVHTNVNYDEIIAESIESNDDVRILTQTEIDKIEESNTAYEAREYLKSTDWYEIRAISGKPVPEDILQKRQEARDSIIKE